MTKIPTAVLALGLVSAIMFSNIASFARDGAELEKLRSSVLRLHILANSDSEKDQELKLMVRDAILEKSDELFSGCSDKESAEKLCEEKLDEIERIAEHTLKKNGCDAKAEASVGETYFDSRTYGDITMPEGEYTALRIEIGDAKGRNWWCVMYPPLCLPPACKAEKSECVATDSDAEECFFDEKQQEILHNPRKYNVRFAIWDKLKELFER
ncbi:MAG: stage II sporulation protein R [Ruminococcus sp.]|nr:stage II sporulation protein R [Ruminococcus sp.]